VRVSFLNLLRAGAERHGRRPEGNRHVTDESHVVRPPLVRTVPTPRRRTR
jgi:hypothetical protein